MIRRKHTMNMEYLNILPEEKNKFKAQLESGEKPVFIAKNVIFGTDTGRAIGWDVKVTMTNRRIIADNGKGVWTMGIAEDVRGSQVVERGKGLMKEHFVQVDLKTPFVFNNGDERITTGAYTFVFKKKEEARFMEIMNNVFAD